MKYLSNYISDIAATTHEALTKGAQSAAEQIYSKTNVLRQSGNHHPELDHEIAVRIRSTEQSAAPDTEKNIEVGKNEFRDSPPFAVKPMLSRFQGEEVNGLGFDRRGPIEYCDENSRQRFLLTIHEGVIHDADGRPYDTTGSGLGGLGDAIFVMDEGGRIFSSKFAKFGEFHHSSFLAGKPVAAAGTLHVKEGIVQRITDRSGHYLPSQPYLMQAVNHLRNQGVKITPGQISLY